LTVCELVVIGASWGGLHAVSVVLAGLPADLDAAVVIAQHRGVDAGDGTLAQVLSRRSLLAVTDAHDKDALVPGRVYLAPADYHLLVEHGFVSLSTDAREQYSRPSIDVLFESAADAYRDRVVGVILTGANQDGAAGLARIRRRGGTAVVQDPTTADKPTMPAAALARAGADKILPLDEIGPFIGDLCGRRAVAGERRRS
jgi:two-component system chemotaxis response regulator CheB